MRVVREKKRNTIGKYARGGSVDSTFALRKILFLYSELLHKTMRRLISTYKSLNVIFIYIRICIYMYTHMHIYIYIFLENVYCGINR